MKLQSPRSRISDTGESNELARMLSLKLVGQPAAIEAIVPFILMHQADLAPEGRPIAVFMLLGPTGTGKTRTVEALAEVLHGNPKKMLKVDCGEFQMEHEVAKLVGAPPGYLGHRETQPMLTQQKLANAASEANPISIVLFDEIEKAASSMSRMLLGILDKAMLRLGDNTAVNFENTVIFLTSNLGARNMQKEIRPDFGFDALRSRDDAAQTASKLEKIGMAAVRRKFPPEFVNRLDAVVTYQPLDQASLSAILNQHIAELQDHIARRLGMRSFQLDVPLRTRRFLLKAGTSEQYGARELKRTLQRQIVQPLAALVAEGSIPPDGRVIADVNATRTKVAMRVLD